MRIDIKLISLQEPGAYYPRDGAKKLAKNVMDARPYILRDTDTLFLFGGRSSSSAEPYVQKIDLAQGLLPFL